MLRMNSNTQVDRQFAITDEQLAIGKPILQAVAAMARLSNQSIFLTDVMHQMSFTIPKVQTNGFALENFVPLDKERIADVDCAMYEEICRQCKLLMGELPREERDCVTFTFCVHSVIDDKLLLQMHRVTPLLVSDDGQVRLTLTTITPALHREAGHFYCLAGGQLMLFNFKSGRWKVDDYTSYLLTEHEREMLMLSARGYTLAEISQRMCCAIDTVKMYRRLVFAKLGVNNITEALYAAIRYQLL